MSGTVPRIRVLPAAAAVLMLLFGLKAVGLGEEMSAFLGAGPARAEDPKPEAGHAPEAEESVPLQDTVSGPTASESDVLESLSRRREQLDERAREIDMREKVLAAAEKRVEQRIAELKAVEARIEVLFGQRDEKGEKQLADLVKMYEAMKPASAAAIFDSLEQDVLIDVVRRMKPAKASPVLAAMKPERARDITVELARLEALPADLDVPPPTGAAETEVLPPLPPGG
jgi:flagellar motility protein MotE (MotC chaperone)